jgi:predicted heme/steroid binding protein
MQEFTETTLKDFNGQNGQPAYVAVDGIVYDVSSVAAWQGGKHHGNLAGLDQSEMIRHSPHGPSVLANLPQVGKLIK